MAKFCDVIGFAEEAVEKPPGSGIWKDNIVERKLYGDVIRNTRDLKDNGEQLNYDLSVNNSISVVADAYARDHFFAIRYVRWAGALWTVDNVSVKPPRLILRLGEVYNGPKAEAETSESTS